MRATWRGDAPDAAHVRNQATEGRFDDSRSLRVEGPIAGAEARATA
jgi:hypothetical protein